MDIATYRRESAINRQAYSQLRDEIRQKHAGEYVALANGRIVGSSNSIEEARQLVEKLTPVPEYYLIFPAHLEPDFDLVYDLAWSA